MVRLAAATLWLVLAGGLGSAAAQPYAWAPSSEFVDFSSPARNLLRVHNLGTTHVESIDLPGGILLGSGAIDPATGHYFLITDQGTGEFAAAPLRLLPGTRPWRGSALFLSPDGLYAYVCDLRRDVRPCTLVRRSDDRVQATYTGVLAVRFDRAGRHVVWRLTGAGATTLAVYEPSAPTVEVWSHAYDGVYPIAVDRDRVWIAQGTILRRLDSATGLEQLSFPTARPLGLIAAGGDFVAGLSTSGSVVLLTSYAAATGEVRAETPIGGPIRAPQALELAITPDNGAVIATTAIYSAGWFLGYSLFAPDSLERLPGGGASGRSVDVPPASAFSADPLCRVVVLPPSVSLPSGGGLAAFAVTPQPGCGAWPVGDVFSTGLPGPVSGARIGPADRSGAGVVEYAVSPNQDASSEAALLGSIAGLPIRIAVAPETEVPHAPLRLRVAQQPGRVTLDWDAAVTGPVLTGFVIEGGPLGAPTALRLAVGAGARTMSLPELPPGEYEVRVRASNRVGEGPPSPGVRFSVGARAAPDAPAGLVADVQATVVRVRWAAPLSGVAPDAFVIEVEVGPGLWVPVVRVPAGTTEFAAVVHGTYRVRVRAATAGALGPSSGEVVVATTACSAAPDAPPALDVMATGRLATLEWTPAGGGAEQYVIEAGSTAGLSDLARFTTPGAEPRVVAAAPPGAYFVRVRGQNACGVGPPSPERVVFVSSP